MEGVVAERISVRQLIRDVQIYSHDAVYVHTYVHRPRFPSRLGIQLVWPDILPGHMYIGPCTFNYCMSMCVHRPQHVVKFEVLHCMSRLHKANMHVCIL